MFGFSSRKRTPIPSGLHCFAVKTGIAKSVGKSDKSKCGSVRALPSINKGEVVLQATDGHHAACVLASGQMSTPRLVPAGVLPTRPSAKPIGIRLISGQWESLEGRIVADTEGGNEAAFPKIGDALPVVGKTPFHETPIQAERRKATDAAPSTHVALGIDLDLLRKAAESLGTTKVTLLVPVPVKDPSQKPGETFVNKPVAVCPAQRDAQTQGVAVVMPLTPDNSAAYYTKVRDLIVASEQRALPKPQAAKPPMQRVG